MLEFELTPKHAGLKLWGDRAALERLHGFVHRVVEESEVIVDKEGFVLGLAYDVRKAFEGQRSVSTRSQYNDELCRIYGVEVLWPVILIQTALLRHAMGFMPANRLDQSIMYELEYVVESSARAAVPVTADEVLHSSRRASVAPYEHLDSVLNSRCVYFVETAPAKRRKVLHRVMETFDPMYAFLAEQGATMRRGIIRPEAFDACEADWPDFEW